MMDLWQPTNTNVKTDIHTQKCAQCMKINKYMSALSVKSP